LAVIPNQNKIFTGRMGVERAAKLLRDYHKSIVENDADLVEKLSTALNSIKKRVVAKVKQTVVHSKWLPAADDSSDIGNLM
jgi:hypothetical protein